MESNGCQDVEMQADESQPIATSTSSNQFNELVDPAKVMSFEDFKAFLQNQPLDLFFEDGKWTKTMTSVVKKVKLSPDRLQLLLNQVPETDINTTNVNGNNLAFLAAKGNQLDNLKYLVECGLDCNAKGQLDRSLLHPAAYWGDEGMVKYLLDKGLDPNARTEIDSTPLHYAVNNVNNDGLSVVKILVEKGAKVLSKNHYGQTPLHTMAMYSDLKNPDVNIIQYLTEIEKKLTVNDRDKDGNTPLHHCRADQKIKKCLIDLGTDLTFKNNEGKTPEQYFTPALQN